VAANMPNPSLQFQLRFSGPAKIMKLEIILVNLIQNWILIGAQRDVAQQLWKQKLITFLERKKKYKEVIYQNSWMTWLFEFVLLKMRQIKGKWIFAFGFWWSHANGSIKIFSSSSRGGEI
jgi:hypothetical protein